MKRFTLAILITAAFALATYAAPANDNFANAQLFDGISGQVSVSNSGATRETGEPYHALNRGGASIWYKFVAPGNGVLRVDNYGTSINTLIAVYRGGSVNNLTPVTANDSCEFNNASACVYFGTQSGVTYYIAVDGRFFEGFGTLQGTIKTNFSFSNSAPNDNFANAYALSGNTASLNSITTSNVGAGKETGEPDHAGNAGGKSVWFKWTNQYSYPRSVTFSLDSQRVSDPSLGANTLMAIYTGENMNALTLVASREMSVFERVRKLKFLAAPGTTYYIAVDGKDAGAGADTGNFIFSCDVTKSEKTPDFDRDGKADLAVYRPTNGTWYGLESIKNDFRAFQWGANGDKPLFGDFGADDKPNYLVFRPDNGIWYLSDGGLTAVPYGLAADVPLMIETNYNHIPLTNFAVFRPSNGTWYLRGGGAYQFGQAGDIPVLADFSGDGTDELTVFRPSNGTWYILNIVTNQFLAVPFGTNGDKPTVADYDADGIADIAVFRPSNGFWYVRESGDGAIQSAQWGAATDRPQPADYTGDGKADICVFRNGTWYIRESGFNDLRAVAFGQNNDIPISAPIQ